MKKEQHYDFRKRLAQVHIPRRSPEALPQSEDEIAIDGSWKIVPLSAEKVLMIGDTVLDIRAAKVNNCFSAAVTWGYSSREELLSVDPDYIFDNAEEFLS